MEEKTNYLVHHGVKGQQWGKRRYQNPDGSLTPEGRNRYGVLKTAQNNLYEEINRIYDKRHKYKHKISKAEQKLKKADYKMNKYGRKGSVPREKWLKTDDDSPRLKRKREKWDRKATKFEDKSDKYADKYDKYDDKLSKLKLKDSKAQVSRDKAIKKLKKINKKLQRDFGTTKEYRKEGKRITEAMLYAGYTESEIKKFVG